MFKPILRDLGKSISNALLFLVTVLYVFQQREARGGGVLIAFCLHKAFVVWHWYISVIERIYTFNLFLDPNSPLATPHVCPLFPE